MFDNVFKLLKVKARTRLTHRNKDKLWLKLSRDRVVSITPPSHPHDGSLSSLWDKVKIIQAIQTQTLHVPNCSWHQHMSQRLLQTSAFVQLIREREVWELTVKKQETVLACSLFGVLFIYLYKGHSWFNINVTVTENIFYCTSTRIK